MKKPYNLATAILLVIGYATVSGQTAPNQENITHEWIFDGDASDLHGTADGTLNGTASIDAGSLILDGDGYVQLPKYSVGFSQLTEFSLEIWFTPAVGNVNAGIFKPLIYLGDQNENHDGGVKYFNYQPTRAVGAGESKACISAEYWNAEKGVVSTELDNNQEYHVVVTVSATELAYYVDGVLVSGTNPASLEGVTLNDLSDSLCYFGKSGYPDQLWKGSIQKIAMYDIALTADNVTYLYNLGSTSPLTGIKLSKTNSSASAYYNRKTSLIVLSDATHASSVNLLNLNGQLVHSYNPTVKTFSTSGLKNGIYFLKISGPNGATIQKIVIY